MSVHQSTDPLLHEFAAEVGHTDAVAVVGNKTRWRVGGSLRPETRLVRAPIGVVEFVASEMIVRVRAGTEVAELHQELANAGQRTALPERGGTVGGALAVGENAFESLGRGLLRDCALQLRYVSAGGETITVGAPVVKNVTGYNATKLMVGSLGTLGLFAEVVLRTNPIPPVSRWFRGAADPTQTRDAVLQPSCLLWDGTHSWVLLEGIEADVDAEAEALGRLAGFDSVAGPPALPPFRLSMTAAQAATFNSSDPFVASIGVGTVWASSAITPVLPDHATLEISARLKAEFDPLGRLNPGRSLTAQPGAS